MTALYLSESDVHRLLDIRVAIEAVEAAFQQLGSGGAANVPRARVQGPGIVLHLMGAAAAYAGFVGWKCYTTTRGGAQFYVGLCDAVSGELAAWIAADRLGQLRTAATTGVAAEYMAAPTAAEVGLFGSGKQARTQLAALAAVRPLKRAFVYSRHELRRVAFADEMSSQLKLEVIPVDRPQEAAEELPIVVTATNSGDPVFDGAWLAEGCLVCAVGSNWPNRAEIDSTVIRRADHIVCDSIDACRLEAGDFRDAIEKGIFEWSRATNLADVVAGRAPGRGRPESISLFKSVGLAIEDVALGARLLARAREAGAGVPLPF